MDFSGGCKCATFSANVLKRSGQFNFAKRLHFICLCSVTCFEAHGRGAVVVLHVHFKLKLSYLLKRFLKLYNGRQEGSRLCSIFLSQLYKKLFLSILMLTMLHDFLTNFLKRNSKIRC